MLDLSKEELLNIMAKRPQVKASKVMNVLIKLSKKKLALEAPKVEKKEETTDEKKAEDAKDEDVEMKEDKKEEEKKVVELDEKPEENIPEQNLVLEIQPFVKYITWEYTDAEYYLKEVKEKLALSMEDQNLAMTQMLESFVAHSNKPRIHQQNTASPKDVQEQIRPSCPSRQSAPPLGLIIL